MDENKDNLEQNIPVEPETKQETTPVVPTEPEKAPEVAPVAPAEPEKAPEATPVASAEPEAVPEATPVAPAEPEKVPEAAPVAPVEPEVEPVETNFKSVVNDTNETQTKFEQVKSEKVKGKKSGKGKVVAIVIAFIVVAAVIAFCVYFFAFKKNAKNQFTSLVSAKSNELIKSMDEADAEKIKTKVKLDLDIDFDKLADEKIIDLLNELDLTTEVAIDKQAKKMNVKIDTEYENKEFLNAQVYFDGNTEKTYMFCKQLFEKFFNVPMETNSYKSLNSLFEKISDSDKEKSKKLIKILTDEFNSKFFKDEDFVVNDVNTKIEGVDQQATKYSYIIDANKLIEKTTELLKSLKQNNEFLDLIGDKDQFVKMVDSTVKETEKAKKSSNTSVVVAVNVYEKVLFPEVIKVELGVYAGNIETVKNTIKDTPAYVSFTATNVSDNKTKIELTSMNQKLFDGTVETKENGKNNENVSLSFSLYNMNKTVGTFKANMEVSTEYGADIKEPDVKNAVDIDSLTKEQQQEVYNNLLNSKFYKVFESIADEYGPTVKTKNKSVSSVTSKDKTIETVNNTFKYYLGTNKTSTQAKNAISLVKSNNIRAKSNDAIKEIYLVYKDASNETYKEGLQATSEIILPLIEKDKTYTIKVENNDKSDEEYSIIDDAGYYKNGQIRVITISVNN